MTTRTDDDASAPTVEARAPGLETRAMRARLQARLFDTGTPARVGDYVVVRALGEGAMGTVFIAYDPDLDRRVAVKVLRRLRGGDEVQASARMEREARAMARLAHPNVVAVHEVGVDDGQVFVAMEYVEGGTLAQWSREHPVDSRARLVQVLDLAVQAARGLQAAHAAGLVHRDLKPANILVGDDYRLRIADFGLARPQGEGVRTTEADAVAPGPSPAAARVSGSQRDDQRLTSTGEIVGTPAYMAPEQFRGVSDERSDQFSWCVTFFEAVYGVRPFSGASLHELAEAVQDGAINKPPANAHVPGWLRRLLERGLSADPAARWPSMEAILAEVARRRGARWRRMIGGLALVAVGVVGTMAYERSRGGEPDGPVCPSVADQLDAAWGPERRAAIERAFESAEVPYAHDAWVRVERGLDAAAQEWEEAKAEVCHAADTEDPRAREGAALRDACLDRGRQAMEFVSDQLAEADGDAVRFSAQTVAGLHDRIRCDQAALLTTPEEGSDDIIDATLVKLEQARALRDLHRLADARATLEQALAPIPEDGFVRLHAQVYQTLVSVAVLAEDRDALRDHATRLIDYAERSGDPELRASAWVSLSLVSRNAQRYDDAAFRVGRAENLASHAPLSDGLRARVARGRADVYSEQQQHGEALPKFREALAILERRSPDSIEVAYLLRSVADSMFGHGEGGGSIELLERSLALHQSIMGPDHPDTAMAHIVLANVLVRLRSEETLGHLAEAERILKANPEYRPSAMGRVHELRGLDTLGRTGGDPEPELRRAEEIFVRTLGPEHSAVFHARLYRANALHTSKRWDEAAAAYRVLLEGPNPGKSQPLTLATARMNYADVEAVLGHREFALEQVAVAREAFDEILGGQGPLWRNTFINVARVYRNAGEPKAAAELLDDVLRAAEESAEPVTAHERLWLQIERGRAALALGRRDEAMAAARLARSLVPEAREKRNSLTFDLAQLEQGLGIASPTDPVPG